MEIRRAIVILASSPFALTIHPEPPSHHLQSVERPTTTATGHYWRRIPSIELKDQLILPVENKIP
jgi:hypothetical protein